MLHNEFLDSHQLARLTTLTASDAIGAEDAAFTPWLAEHIDELGEAIEVPLQRDNDDLELEAQIKACTEVAVGPFRLDILARTLDGRAVAIENQYGQSDHKHLGQVITYASGVGADVVVWIAESFTDPHLEALRWLNERTDEKCGVFAIRIQFVRIGNSPPAPIFDVVVRPSEFARVQRKTSLHTENWTVETFLASISGDTDRVAAAELINRTLATGGHVWGGVRPKGRINLHPGAIVECAIALTISPEGRARVHGHWNFFSTVRGHDAFAPVAAALGQDHKGPSAGVIIENVDIDELWNAVLQYNAEIASAE